MIAGCDKGSIFFVYFSARNLHWISTLGCEFVRGENTCLLLAFTLTLVYCFLLLFGLTRSIRHIIRNSTVFFFKLLSETQGVFVFVLENDASVGIEY